MKTTLEPNDQAKTDFHYFCELLLLDLETRAYQDCSSDKEAHLCKKLADTIRDARDFAGIDPPVDDAVLMNDIKTFDRPTEAPLKKVRVPQVIINILRMALIKVPLAALLLLISMTAFSQNDALGYVARVSTVYGDATELKILEQPSEPTSFTEGLVLIKPGDTIRVGLRLSCKEPQYIWSGYRVRVKLSDSAYGHKYLGPDKKPLPRGCQILEIIWPMKKGTSDIIPE